MCGEGESQRLAGTRSAGLGVGALEQNRVNCKLCWLAMFSYIVCKVIIQCSDNS